MRLRYTYGMIKTNVGAAKPRLSELLHRRGQSVAAFAKELGLKTDESLQMHCTMHGIHKDMVLAPAVETVAPKLEKPVQQSKKKPAVKNALVDLTTLVHAGAAAISGNDSPDEG